MGRKIYHMALRIYSHVRNYEYKDALRITRELVVMLEEEVKKEEAKHDGV